MRLDLAIALGYDPGEDLAPRVLARGRGALADRLRRIADEAGVPVQSDAGLAELLAALPLQEEVPSDLYPILAECFAFLYRTSKRCQEQRLARDE